MNDSEEVQGQLREVREELDEGRLRVRQRVARERELERHNQRQQQGRPS